MELLPTNVIDIINDAQHEITYICLGILFVLDTSKVLLKRTLQKNGAILMDITQFNDFRFNPRLSAQEYNSLPRALGSHKTQILILKVLEFLHTRLGEIIDTSRLSQPDQLTKKLSQTKGSLNQFNTKLRQDIIKIMINSPLVLDPDLLEQGNPNRFDNLFDISDQILAKLVSLGAEGKYITIIDNLRIELADYIGNQRDSIEKQF